MAKEKRCPICGGGIGLLNEDHIDYSGRVVSTCYNCADAFNKMSSLSRTKQEKAEEYFREQLALKKSNELGNSILRDVLGLETGSNQNCEECGKTTALYSCKITSKFDTKYRRLCADCISKYKNEGRVEILEMLEDNSSCNDTGSDKNHISKDILITTGPSFEGYRITEYKGIVFEETIAGIGLETVVKSVGDILAPFTGSQMYAYTERINELKTKLINSLMVKASLLGANAIIAIDFENTFPANNAIMISANGTAVIVERD